MGAAAAASRDVLRLPGMPDRATVGTILEAAAAGNLGVLCATDWKYARVCRDEVVWRRVCRAARCPPKPPVRQWLHHYVRSKRPAYGARIDDAMQVASRGGHAEDVRLLLAAGADVHVDDDEALGLASEDGYVDVVCALLAAGADTNASGGWPIHAATGAGHMDVVHLLLAAGARAP